MHACMHVSAAFEQDKSLYILLISVMSQLWTRAYHVLLVAEEYEDRATYVDDDGGDRAHLDPSNVNAHSSF